MSRLSSWPFNLFSLNVVQILIAGSFVMCVPCLVVRPVSTYHSVEPARAGRRQSTGGDIFVLAMNMVDNADAMSDLTSIFVPFTLFSYRDFLIYDFWGFSLVTCFSYLQYLLLDCTFVPIATRFLNMQLSPTNFLCPKCNCTFSTCN